MRYDNSNIFANILSGDIPCKKVTETGSSLAFYDICPRAETHIIVIPKGYYISHSQFYTTAADNEILDFFRVVGRICSAILLSGGESSKLISNEGAWAGQEVFHFHCHILSNAVLDTAFLSSTSG